jgi:hypothetical protein
LTARALALASILTSAFSPALNAVVTARLAATHAALSTTSAITTCLPLLETCCKCCDSNAMGGSQVADIGRAQLASLVQSDRSSGNRSEETEKDGGGRSGEAHFWIGDVEDELVLKVKTVWLEECLRGNQEEVADCW